MWFVALVTVWSLCLRLAITPFVIAALIGLAFMTRGFAAIEAEIARALLDVDAHAPAARPSRDGFWAWLRGQFGAGFWRVQAYLLIRWLAGFPVAVAVVTVLAAALGMLFARAWVPFVDGEAQLGFWRPHMFLQTLALGPAGLVLLPISLLIVPPLAEAFRPIAFGLLRADDAAAAAADTARGSVPAVRPRRTFEIHAAADPRDRGRARRAGRGRAVVLPATGRDGRSNRDPREHPGRRGRRPGHGAAQHRARPP